MLDHWRVIPFRTHTHRASSHSYSLTGPAGEECHGAGAPLRTLLRSASSVRTRSSSCAAQVRYASSVSYASPRSITWPSSTTLKLQSKDMEASGSGTTVPSGKVRVIGLGGIALRLPLQQDPEVQQRGVLFGGGQARHLPAFRTRLLLPGQIGRASCRERV